MQMYFNHMNKTSDLIICLTNAGDLTLFAVVLISAVA